MSDIKFGTDGWRAIIADTYTVSNVKRVAFATAKWLKKYHQNPLVVIGHDCRFGGPLFSMTTAKVLASEGIKVFLDKNFVSTPVISLCTKLLKANAGVIITASHNPPTYNGYKIKAYYGGPALPDMISEVEEMIIPASDVEFQLTEADELVEKKLLEYVNLSEMYTEHAKKSFDLKKIKNSGIKIAFNPMFGSAQNMLSALLPDVYCFNCEYNPLFNNTPPEPIMKNLEDFAAFIRKNDDIQIGIATDGDGDRIGILDSNGNFVDSHHMILMLINYLHKYKGLEGTIATSFSCSRKIAKMCQTFNLPHIITKIGFKYICEYMLKENILVGGEESGGIALSTHIPERDGIWIGLTLLEYMATTGKDLQDLIDEVYAITGPFNVDRNDLHISEELKIAVMKKCKNNEFASFGSYQVREVETTDGFKFIFDDDRSLMIRPSGTEPVLRTYAEAPDAEEVKKLLIEAERVIRECEV